MIRLSLVIITLLALVIITIISLGRYFEVAEVTLPDVIGMNVEDATRTLRQLELNPVTYVENIPSAQVGAVTSQSPRAGETVRRGRSVSVGVNSPPENVTIPSLIGITREQASATLQTVNLEMGEVNFEYNDAPEGTVIAQAPEADTMVLTGSTVTITLSRGPEVPDVTMPELRGLTMDEARKRLKASGFANVTPVATSLSFDRPGVVTDQFPSPNQITPLSTPVTLYYALAADQVIHVPNLKGSDVRRAVMTIQAAGLTVGDISYQNDPAQPQGVLSYRPSTYTVRGAPVELVVNGAAQNITGLLQDNGTNVNGADTGTSFGFEGVDIDSTPPIIEGDNAGDRRTIPFNFDPASLGVSSLRENPYDFRLVVSDAQGERTVIDERIDAGESVSTTVTVYGNALLQTYINDILYQAWNP